MKISELKQPYRRMAEYLAERNTNKEILNEAFSWDLTNYLFWLEVDNGNYPEITEEIKEHFPSDFDFSSEEESLNQKYTQLAKEGRFDQLPETCEFSEAVEMDVWDLEGKLKITKNVIGKFKGKFISGRTSYSLLIWNFAQLPTKKIDFTQFKAGDVVEVEEENLFYGQLCGMDDYLIFITFGICENAELTKCIEKEKIKSITKIK